MSTVMEIKQAVVQLARRKSLALAGCLQAQRDDRLGDEDMMAIAAEGARALDEREAAYAKRQAPMCSRRTFCRAADRPRPARVWHFGQGLEGR